MKKWFTPSTVWYNQLGSKLTLSSVDEDKGSFIGKYYSAVGNAENEYDLSGRYDTDGRTLGWVVSYKNSCHNAHSTCAWCGQIEFAEDTMEKPIILTTWLLTRQTTPDKDWDSTEVGFDNFSTFQPSEDDIRLAKLRKQRSHP